MHIPELVVSEQKMLWIDKRQQLSIATIGATTGDPRYCEVIRIGITTASGQRKEFKLLIVSHICEPLLTQPVDYCSRMYSHSP